MLNRRYYPFLRPGLRFHFVAAFPPRNGADQDEQHPRLQFLRPEGAAVMWSFVPGPQFVAAGREIKPSLGHRGWRAFRSRLGIDWPVVITPLCLAGAEVGLSPKSGEELEASAFDSPRPDWDDT